MLYKTTDLQERYGYGMSQMCGNMANTFANGTTDNGKVDSSATSNSYYIGKSPTQNYSLINGTPLDLFMSTPTGFYGVDGGVVSASFTDYSASSPYPKYMFSNKSFGVVKLFHSWVIGNCLSGLLDPNMILYNGNLYTSINYSYDLTNLGTSYKNTYYSISEKNYTYSKKMKKISDDFGSIPDIQQANMSGTEGSATTGTTDILYTKKIFQERPSDIASTDDPKAFAYYSKPGNMSMFKIFGCEYMKNFVTGGITSTTPTDGAYVSQVEPGLMGPFSIGGFVNMDDTSNSSNTSTTQTGSLSLSQVIARYQNAVFIWLAFMYYPESTTSTPYDDYEGGVPSQWV